MLGTLESKTSPWATGWWSQARCMHMGGPGGTITQGLQLDPGRSWHFLLMKQTKVKPVCLQSRHDAGANSVLLDFWVGGHLESESRSTGSAGPMSQSMGSEVGDLGLISPVTEVMG